MASSFHSLSLRGRARIQARVTGHDGGSGHSGVPHAKAFYRRLQQLYEAFGERVIRSTPAFVVGGQLISALSTMDRDTRGVGERLPGGFGEDGDVDLAEFEAWRRQQAEREGQEGQGDTDGNGQTVDQGKEEEQEQEEEEEEPSLDLEALLVSGTRLGAAGVGDNSRGDVAWGVRPLKVVRLPVQPSCFALETLGGATVPCGLFQAPLCAL